DAVTFLARNPSWDIAVLQGATVAAHIDPSPGGPVVVLETLHGIVWPLQADPDAIPKPAGGLGGILAAANEVIQVKNDQILFIVLGIIFILCAVTYRSILAGVIFVMSLILANFLAFTYMVFKNIGLNINTFPVVSLGIGLGVDYGLYIVSRIIEVYKEEQDLAKAVRGGIITSGRAVFFTATMMTAGVIFWYFSPLRFQAEMGILLGILMMVNMVVGVLVLPAVINIIKPKFITKGGENNGGYRIPPGTLPK
ncbi:MAG: MMPL family transporter, partial [Deltaproteobacteria bacterium]|nr:MMPL family transporter [Deltaproteobacteria bacterium]